MPRSDAAYAWYQHTSFAHLRQPRAASQRSPRFLSLRGAAAMLSSVAAHAVLSRSLQVDKSMAVLLRMPDIYYQ